MLCTHNHLGIISRPYNYKLSKLVVVHAKVQNCSVTILWNLLLSNILIIYTPRHTDFAFLHLGLYPPQVYYAADGPENCNFYGLLIDVIYSPSLLVEASWKFSIPWVMKKKPGPGCRNSP